MDTLDKYEEAHAAFRTGSVLTDSDERLLLYLSGLSNQANINPGTQHRDIIRGLTINSILLKRHIESLQGHITELNAKNSVTTWAVIVLTVASLTGTGMQTWYADKADKRSEAGSKSTEIALQSQMQRLAVQSSSSNQSAAQDAALNSASKK